nr:hypothetical protein PJ912_25725 [Pectobacterium colocasium]
MSSLNVLRTVSKALVDQNGHFTSRSMLYPAIQSIATSAGQINPEHANTGTG